MLAALASAAFLTCGIFASAQETYSPTGTYKFAVKDGQDLCLDHYAPAAGSETAIDGHAKPTVLFAFGGGFKGELQFNEKTLFEGTNGHNNSGDANEARGRGWYQNFGSIMVVDKSGKIFESFLEANSKELKKEFYIPYAIDCMIKSGEAKTDVLSTPSHWFGVTYKEDRPAVVAKFQEFADNGVYPTPLYRK